MQFSTAKPPVDEAELKAAMPEAGIKAVAQALARAKALALSKPGDMTIVIGADQTLEHDGKLFDKPDTLSQAERQLQTLRGTTHQLHSAVACAQDGKIIWEDVSTATLTMRDFSDAELHRYLKLVGDKALTSVGAYQIEGPGLSLFDRIDGDYFTILGLPLLPLLAFLRQQGAQLP